MSDKKVTDAQKRASKNYTKRGKFINVFFTENEMPLYHKIVASSEFFGMHRTTYIKSILKGVLENDGRKM